MNDANPSQLEFAAINTKKIVAPFKFPASPAEYRVTPLRECPMPEKMDLCDTPDRAAEYWTRHVTSHPCYNPEVECLVAVMLNTRRRVKGHYLIATGLLDTILIAPREFFRLAIMTGAAALVAMHNHPSGEPEPSQADINATRDLVRAGQLLKIELLDHVIIGAGRHASLRSLGFL